MCIKFTTKGDWGKTYSYLKRLQSNHAFAIMEKYARQGLVALQAATPVDSSETANSWSYEIVRKPGSGYFAIHWYNSHMENGIPIAVILQYGHGTGTGGYVQGRDYINPAVQPIFDQMIDEMWREVTK